MISRGFTVGFKVKILSMQHNLNDFLNGKQRFLRFLKLENQRDNYDKYLSNLLLNRVINTYRVYFNSILCVKLCFKREIE